MSREAIVKFTKLWSHKSGTGKGGKDWNLCSFGCIIQGKEGEDAKITLALWDCDEARGNELLGQVYDISYDTKFNTSNGKEYENHTISGMKPATGEAGVSAQTTQAPAQNNSGNQDARSLITKYVDLAVAVEAELKAKQSTIAMDGAALQAATATIYLTLKGSHWSLEEKPVEGQEQKPSGAGADFDSEDVPF